MLRNYFKVAIRHLMRHKLFSILNILCLAIGITFSLVIGMYVLHERSVNTDLSDYRDLYVIKSKWKQELMGIETATLAPLAKTVREQYPQLVNNYYRFFRRDMTISTSGEDHAITEPVTLCDTTLVTMFGFKLLYGVADAAFQNMQSAVVTESFAFKYFGKKDVVGRPLHIFSTGGRLDSKTTFVISAVMKDPEENSINDFYDSKQPCQIFVPYESNPMGVAGFRDWSLYDVSSIVKLQPGVKPEALNRPLADLLNLHLTNVFRNNVTVNLTSLRDFYQVENNGKVEKLTRTLSYISIFILVIAVINFVNIMIGTSGYRLKEIGLRKVFGGRRKQLVIQYICESFALTFIATFFSLLFYEGLRPVAFQLLKTNLPQVWQFGSGEISFLFMLILITGFVSGIYPALVLSGSNMNNAVKGKSDRVKEGTLLKRGLLIVQFAITMIVFIVSLNISRQVSFFLSKDLGYDKSGLLLISTMPGISDSTDSYLSKVMAFRDDLRGIANVGSSAISFEIPNGEYADNLNLIPEGSTANDVVSLPYLVTDENYAKTYGLRLKEGRFLDHKALTDTLNEVVVNEAAVKAFGWQSGVGKKVKLAFAGIWVTVVGVVEDFNFFSLRKKVSPLAFANVSNFKRCKYVSVRFRTNNISGMMTGIKDKWNVFFPGKTLEYSFMDDKLKALYTSELQLRTTVNIATAMNMVIVFLSIFGVLVSALHKRAKEMAVRKVLGADTSSIVGIFVREYVYLILLALVIAGPLAYYLTDRWLQDYAYHITQNAIPYIVVAMVILAATTALIAGKCYKVASRNMMNSLRAE
jgi:putative ABC transport system permease protein